MEIGIQGTTYLSFIVEIDGSLTGITIMKGVSKTLDAEAIRIVKLMPKWKAGEQVKGTAVRCRYVIPVKARFIN
jgi:Ca-activated chloride channel family protein